MRAFWPTSHIGLVTRTRSCLLASAYTYVYHPIFALARFNLLRSIYRKRMAAPGGFLESISPWSTRSNTPKPGQGKDLETPKLSNQQGTDHSIGHRHRLSLSQYPRDCPPSLVRWFYAVDVSSSPLLFVCFELFLKYVNSLQSGSRYRLISLEMRSLSRLLRNT